MSLTAADLLGPWHLERFVIGFADDRPPVFPFGEDARGQLMYCPDGHMSGTVCRNTRRPFGARLEASYHADADLKAEAFDGYLAYAGTWRVEGDEVIHTVDFALTPDLVGRENRRTARLEHGPYGVRLHLSYTLTAKSGIERNYTLIWRRP